MYIIDGLPESYSTVVANHILDDTTYLSDKFIPLSIILTHNCKLIRLGKLSTDNKSLLKIICSSKDEIVSLVSKFSSTRKIGLYIYPRLFQVSQRQNYYGKTVTSVLYELELERSCQAGEVDFVIAYFNGVPRSLTVAQTFTSKQAQLNQVPI